MVSTRDHSLHYFKLPLCSMSWTELQKCVVAFSFRRRVDRLMKRLAGQLAIVDYPCLHDELISMATNTTVQPCTLFPISSLRHQTRTKEASSSSIGSYILARSGYLSHWLPQSMSFAPVSTFCLSRIISVFHQLAMILFSSTSLPPYSSLPGWLLHAPRYLFVPQ